VTLLCLSCQFIFLGLEDDAVAFNCPACGRVGVRVVDPTEVASFAIYGAPPCTAGAGVAPRLDYRRAEWAGSEAFWTGERVLALGRLDVSLEP